MQPTVSQMCVFNHSTLEQALKVIDSNAMGLCFVLDGTDQTFMGVISDGDIRRSLLQGKTIHSSVSDVVNRQAVTMPIHSSPELIQSQFSNKIKIIPLLSDDKQVVDFASPYRLQRIPVMEPHFGGNELAYVTDCIKTGWISSKGQYVNRFENQMAKINQSQFALAVSNGTVALHLAIEALGIGPGDEVIVPDFTFAASINSILYAGATPVIVDINPGCWTISVEQVEKAITPQTKAIMPVHIYGHPCEIEALQALAKKHNLFIIEDCAEALGSTYKGQPVGSFGDAATFSFFGNKLITTGEGGVVLFKNPEHYNRGKVLRDHGMNPTKRYWHDLVGFNYRMTNLQAAVGVAQLEQFDGFLSKRTEMAKNYSQAFSKMSTITSQTLRPNVTSCYWLYTVLLNPDSKLDRDTLIQKLLMNGIETRPTFYPLHEMPPYQKFARDRQFPVTTDVSRRGLSLPSSVHISENEIQNIVSKIKDLVEPRPFENML